MSAKKTMLVLLCVTAMGICIKGQAAAEKVMPTGKMQSLLELDSKERDWKIMYGLKVWENEWSLPVELRAGDKPFILEYESDTAITYIPTLLVFYHNFFISGSYLLDTEYDFSDQQIKNYISDEDGDLGFLQNIDMSGSRKEWDLNIGYFLTPNIAVSLGYKNLERDLTLTSTVESTPILMKSLYPLSVHAPIIGLTAYASVTDKLNFYGNLAYGWLGGDATYEATDFKNNLDVDGSYVFGELGFGYAIPFELKYASTVTINAGYRFQRLDMTFSDGGAWGKSGDQHDSTAGFVLGVAASY
jgi:hypothetical protein